MRADIRLWTALAIIGICGFSVARGWNIAHFSLATARIESSEKRTEAMQTWIAVPDVAAAALQVGLKQTINSDDAEAAQKRRQTLAAILAIKPLSSVDWLSLSRLQLVTDQPMPQVLGSLLLSMVTGPNEGYVRAERGILGASIWENLSPELQRRAASDLTAAEIIDNARFRAVLMTKSEVVRSELRTAMLATGLSSKEVERRLGF